MILGFKTGTQCLIKIFPIKYSSYCHLFTGHVRIFTVENLEHLKNSTLDLKSGIEYHVHTKSINWLQVTEIQEKLITIAITDDKIYSINFISKNSIE